MSCSVPLGSYFYRRGNIFSESILIVKHSRVWHVITYSGAEAFEFYLIYCSLAYFFFQLVLDFKDTTKKKIGRDSVRA